MLNVIVFVNYNGHLKHLCFEKSEPIYANKLQLMFWNYVYSIYRMLWKHIISRKYKYWMLMQNIYLITSKTCML
jgi:hypothetical protein